MIMSKEEMQKALKTLVEHTQHYIPVEDMSALEIAMMALEEKINNTEE